MGGSMGIEWWVVIATIAGPVIAVQTQKWIERATESRRRRRYIFDVMMSNRATRLADEHVRALNMLDLEFRAKRDAPVIAAWRALFGELTQGIKDGETDQTILNAWNRRCDDLYVTLLSAISKRLGFSFVEEDLRRGIYYPRGHSERETAQLAILHGLGLILEGRAALSMKVTEFPTSQQVVDAQTILLDKLSKAYTADGELRVSISEGASKAKGKG
jgi:uncharacterized protein DUF6680